MHLQNVNLNLLVHLEALLAQRSVSGAADQLELSQPTVSSALARLRRHFGDPLLAREGNRYELTPLAMSLQPLVADAVSASERVFMSRSEFEPRTAPREFVILTSDYWLEAVGPIVSRSVRDAAPHVRLRFEQLRIADLDDPIESLRNVDGILLPHGAMRDAPHVDVLRTGWRALVDAGNQHVGDVLDRDTLASLPWVAYGDRSPVSSSMVSSIIMRQLNLAGLDPRVEVVVGTFSAIPGFIRGTDRVAVVHQSLALNAEAMGGLRSMPLPLSSDDLVLALWWHPHHNHDHAHKWLRRTIADACEHVSREVMGFSSSIDIERT